MICLNQLTDSLLDQQETLTEVLRRRLIERRRSELAKEIQDAQREFKNGAGQSATASEIIKEILS